MNRFTVTAHALNVRNAPTASDSFNIVGIITFRTVVERIEETNSNWWKIKTITTGLIGFVAARFLEPVLDDPIVVQGIQKADYPKSPSASLFSKGVMHKPIGNPVIPHREMTNPDAKRRSIENLVNILNVEHSERYRRTERFTFCNIYAYDFCHFCDTYIPRVWWNQNAIRRLLQGEQVELLYDQTVFELNANALHDWLLEWGDEFGWIRMQGPDHIQNAVNQEGGVGIICAKRRDTSLSGHITVIVPETEQHHAHRQAGVVIHPLQSQAGARNRKYFSGEVGPWWRGDKFSSFVFFFHP